MIATISIEIVLLFVLSNTVFLGFLFFAISSENKSANTYLGLFLISVSVSIYNILFGDSFLWEQDEVTSWLFEPFLFQIPFLLMYLCKTIGKKITVWMNLLFVPGLVHNGLMNLNELLWFDTSLSLYVYAIYLAEIVLLIYALNLLEKHSKALKNFYSDLKNKKLRWLKILFVLMITLHGLIVLSDVFEVLDKHWMTLEYLILYAILGIVLLIPFWIGYNGLSHPMIFKQNLLLLSDGLRSSETGQALQLDTAISKEELQQFIEVKQRIKDEGLYTDPNLNLRSLSNSLDIGEKELSRLINRCGKVNFYRFVNEFRVERFKELLASPKAEQLSNLGLANEAGFSSKSTFYASFKEIEGMTPKEYKDLNSCPTKGIRTFSTKENQA